MGVGFGLAEDPKENDLARRLSLIVYDHSRKPRLSIDRNNNEPMQGRLSPHAWIGFMLCSAVVTAWAADSGAEIFAFKFSPGHPLVYAIDVKSKTVTDQEVGDRHSETRNNSDLRYKVRLTATGSAKEGLTVVHYEPFDLEQDLGADGPTGTVKTTIRGLDVVVRQNEIVVVDTKNDIGMLQAKNIRLSYYPLLLSGDITLDRGGAIQKLSGDLPFVQNWTEQKQTEIAFFHIQFPDTAKAVKDAWMENFTLHNSGGIEFGVGGLTVTNEFTRQADTTEQDNPLATFDLSMSAHEDSLSGYFDQGGQKTAIGMSPVDATTAGNFHFDQKGGFLVDGQESASFKASVNMVVQGRSVSTRANTQSDWQIKLVPP